MAVSFQLQKYDSVDDLAGSEDAIGHGKSAEAPDVELGDDPHG